MNKVLSKATFDRIEFRIWSQLNSDEAREIWRATTWVGFPDTYEPAVELMYDAVRAGIRQKVFE